jgi:Ca2+-binding EF-hand superfamily protein
MLRKILYDILAQNESFICHFQSEFRKHQTSGCLSYQSLQAIFRSIGRNHDRRETIFLLIDAVDESSREDRQSILQLIIDVVPKMDPAPLKQYLQVDPFRS